MTFGVCLGAIPSGPTPHLPVFSDYATDGPTSPVDWGRNTAAWPMLRNDVLGDCSVAGVGHVVQGWTSYRGYGQERIMSDAEAETAYRTMGWDGSGEGPGARLCDVLTKWSRDGFQVGGRLDVIAGFSRIDPTRLDHVRQALHTFGPVYAGFLLPLAAQGQDVWLKPMNLVGLNAPASWGPHCAVITAIDDLLATVITWGGTQLVDVGWLQVYGDEYWSVVSSDWTGPGGRAPSGFDVAGLFSAMASLSA